MGIVLILAGIMVVGFLWFFLFPFVVLWCRVQVARSRRRHKIMNKE